MVPLNFLLISDFNERELEFVLCGREKIDAEDWRQNTTYREFEFTHPNNSFVTSGHALVIISINPFLYGWG